MSGKQMVFGGLLAVAALSFSAGTASAGDPFRGGGYRGGHGHHYGYYGRPVVVQPVYQPVYRPVGVYPTVVGGYPWGNFGSPLLNSGYAPVIRTYQPVRGNFGTVNVGVYRPGFGLNLGFVIR